METSEICVGATYEGRSGALRTVVRIVPQQSHVGMEVHYEGQRPRRSGKCYLETFARWAVREVTEIEREC